jgi:hypothetical protein
MKCLRCGYDNPQEARFCLSCRTAVPRNLMTQELKPPTPLLEYLRSIRERIESGTLERERVPDLLQKVLEHMEAQRDRCIQQNLELPPELSQASHGRTISAMEDFIGAVNKMMLYGDDGDMAHLAAGLMEAECADMNFQDSLGSEEETALLLNMTTLILPPPSRYGAL